MTRILRALLCALFAVMAGSAVAAPPAIPPSYADRQAIARAVTGPTINCLGDSICSWNNNATPAGSAYFSSSYNVGTGAASMLGWVAALSNNAFALDFAQGYPGSYGALTSVTPLTGGSCTPSATLTFTPAAPTGSPANQASAFTLATDAGGAVPVGAKVTIATPGSGYIAIPAYTISGGSCTTAPTFSTIIAGTFTWGVPGDVTAGTLARVADVCANPPDWIILQIGTNDIAAAVPVATINGNIAATVAGLQSCNVRVVIRGISPRTQGAWTAAMDKIRLQVNRASSQFARQSRAASNRAPVLYLDSDPTWTDPTVSTGNVLSTKVADGLHPGIQGSMDNAISFLNTVRSVQAAGQHIYQPNSQSDVYDATNNPAGNLLGTTGLMLGTGGSNTACAGTVATAWQVAVSGTGTPTCAASIETSRTDGLPGQRQVATFSVVSGGTTERVAIANYTNYGSSLTKGADRIYATAEVDVSNLSNVTYVGCQLLETAPTSQQATSVNSGTVGAAFPMASSVAMALRQESKLLPDFGLTAAGSFRIPCRTGVITTQAGSTGYALTVTMQGTASGVTMTGTVKVGNVAVRKVLP